MLIMNIFLILLYCTSLSFQKIQSGLFCDDRITDIYVYDERLGRYRHLQTLNNPADCYNVDYVDLDVDPGALIKFSCRNDAAETLGGGCFLINNNCSCYDFRIDGKDYDSNGQGRLFTVDFKNGINCSHYSKFLEERKEGTYYYYHNVPLDVNEIECYNKTISSPINSKSSLKFSNYIKSLFKVTYLNISIDKNYQIFILNNQQLSQNTKFNILNDIEYSYNQSSKLNIQFINYGIEINNTRTCEINIRFCYDSCEECNDIDTKETSHQCLKCKDNYYFIENTTNCMTKAQMNNSHYYFDNKAEIFRQCPNECSTCDNETYCTTCAKGFDFQKETRKCEEQQFIKSMAIKYIIIFVPLIALLITIVGTTIKIYEKFSKKNNNELDSPINS